MIKRYEPDFEIKNIGIKDPSQSDALYEFLMDVVNNYEGKPTLKYEIDDEFSAMDFFD